MENKAKSRSRAPLAIDPQQRYELAEVTASARQSRTKTYLDIRDGKLSAFRVGRRVYVSGAELIRYLAPPAATNESRA